jgi:hypothetical protein
MQTSQRQPEVVAPDPSIDSAQIRLQDAEAQIDALANVCNDLGNELSRFSAEANARIKSARTWGMILVAWNVALTITVLVLLLRR